MELQAELPKKSSDALTVTNKIEIFFMLNSLEKAKYQKTEGKKEI